jgi:hypothetical protein
MIAPILDEIADEYQGKLRFNATGALSIHDKGISQGQSRYL